MADMFQPPCGRRHHQDSLKCTLIVFAVHVATSSVNSQIILTSSINHDAKVCPGDEITFTCETNGSLILAWSSEEYIGGGGAEIEFRTIDRQGLTVRSNINRNVIATLELADPNSVIITSTLEVEASEGASNLSVTCVYRSNQALNERRDFQYLGQPGPPRNVTAVQISQTSMRQTCIVLVEWSHPMNTDVSDIGRYAIEVISGRNVTTTVEVSFLIEVPSCGRDVVLRVRAINRCGTVGIYSDMVTAAGITINTDPEIQTSRSNVIVIGVISGVALLVGLIGLLIVAIAFAVRFHHLKSWNPYERAPEGNLEEDAVEELRDAILELYQALKSQSDTRIQINARMLISKLKKTTSSVCIKEALKGSLETIKWEEDKDILRALEKLTSGGITIDQTLKGDIINLKEKATKNEHQEFLIKVQREVDSSEPQTIKTLLWGLCEELTKEEENPGSEPGAYDEITGSPGQPFFVRAGMGAQGYNQVGDTIFPRSCTEADGTELEEPI